jgi:hypothetical protein
LPPSSDVNIVKTETGRSFTFHVAMQDSVL